MSGLKPSNIRLRCTKFVHGGPCEFVGEGVNLGVKRAREAEDRQTATDEHGGLVK